MVDNGDLDQQQKVFFRLKLSCIYNSNVVSSLACLIDVFTLIPIIFPEWLIASGLRLIESWNFRPHAYLLRLVLDEPNLTQKEIGDLLHLEKPTITRFVDKMIGDGYLVRCQVQAETRSAVVVKPTKKALQIKDHLNDLGDGLYRKMKTFLGEEELKLMVNSISRAAYRLSD